LRKLLASSLQDPPRKTRCGLLQAVVQALPSSGRPA
jgi:hypothetical protein